MAERFLAWLRPPPGRRWIDVGCGTGALSATVLRTARPATVIGVDQSPAYLQHAGAHLASAHLAGGHLAGGHLAGDRVQLHQGDARSLPVPDAFADYVVSGLVLNFLPDPGQAVTEMARVCRTGGTVAGYVWDYAEGMQLIRSFWDAAVALDPAASELDEGNRFPLCRPGALAALFTAAGLTGVDTVALEVPTTFRDFDDYWTPFLGGQGPAPGYCVDLPAEARQRLAQRLRSTLPIAADGSIPLTARAWAVRGSTIARVLDRSDREPG